MPGKPTLKGVVEQIKDNVAIAADAIYTDESNLYGTVAGCIKNHKHGIIGSCHQVSIKHLHRYLLEFHFRWNNREAESVFTLVMTALVIAAVLPYAQLIGKLNAATSLLSDELNRRDGEPS